MAKIRQLYALKSEEPQSLTVFHGYIVHKESLTATPIRVVQRDRSSVININTGAVLIVGASFFYDPEEAIDILVAEHKKQIKSIESGLADLEDFRKRVKKAKEEGKK